MSSRLIKLTLAIVFGSVGPLAAAPLNEPIKPIPAAAKRQSAVLNAAFNFRQFWNGRADSFEAQIDAVIQNLVEMGSTWAAVIAKLSQDAAYRRAFAAAYQDGITKANIQNALASFERTLTGEWVDQL